MAQFWPAFSLPGLIFLGLFLPGPQGQIFKINLTSKGGQIRVSKVFDPSTFLQPHLDLLPIPTTFSKRACIDIRSIDPSNMCKILRYNPYKKCVSRMRLK